MTFDINLDIALTAIQDPERAKWLSKQVIDALEEIDGYDAVPREMQSKIAELVACFYGAGYYHGTKDKP